ncbi:MAG: hypothetical protein RIA09_10070 [Hoeflea sp.]|uniref:hypothetical protein n=1 Tax=Hoeflea sp. TaxID=1940281 RepID=UPI0032EDF33A
MDDNATSQNQTQSGKTSQAEKETVRPSHIAYHVRQNGEDKAYFNRVGSAFPHKDGEGFNIFLDAMPVDGRVTLRTAQERLQTAKQGKAENSNQQNLEIER